MFSNSKMSEFDPRGWVKLVLNNNEIKNCLNYPMAAGPNWEFVSNFYVFLL